MLEKVSGSEWLSSHAGCQEFGRCHTKGNLENPPRTGDKALIAGVQQLKFIMIFLPNFLDLINFRFSQFNKQN